MARAAKRKPAPRVKRKRAAPRKSPPAKRSRASKSVIKSLHQIALRANDINASVAFFRDLLGLRLIARFDPPGLAFFDLGGAWLMLSPQSTEGTLYFAVNDLERAVAKLRATGLTFEHPPAMIHRDDAGHFGRKGGEEWMAFFRDPSGNLLALASRKKR